MENQEEEKSGTPATSLTDRYQPEEVEARLYKWWEESGFFKAQDKSTKPPFSIILPPPNVTGQLHMGHALDHSIQDLLVRWKRMLGFNVLWLPGTDHAGIATQTVVERELKKQGTSRTQLGREAFVEKVWDWKHQYGDRICQQMRRLGDSVDWDRAVFTLDENVSQSVKRVFVALHKKGWIYRGRRLVNWSAPLETAISDLEVEHKQVKGSLYHIRYPVEGSDQVLVVATTRPETLLGDSAVAVHPEDERYKSLIGKNVLLPLTKRKIRIIGDSFVDREFGSGVVKITPAHDFNDYKVGVTHNLEFINILTKQGLLNENAGAYAGLKVTEARKKVLEDLTALGLFEKEEPHIHSVGHCSRSGAVVEPFLSDQWFVKTDQLAVPARRVVESGTIRFEPESWTKVYLHWMSIIEDWCISRQLWWGHRIPAWHCQACQHITVAEESVKECEKCNSKEVRQDEDVLDTWFSSALWPFSTMGWPQDTELQKTFYPTSYLVTGHDIIFFWVSRMIMMGLEFKKDVPFRTVYVHGLVRDSQGRKMSKSVGNVVDPVEMIDKYGADALRFSLLSHLHSGKDTKFSEQRLEGHRNFMNKIWNATRFILSHIQDRMEPQFYLQPSSEVTTSVFDQWIVKKLEDLELKVRDSMESERFSDAANAIYQFVWYEFCDWSIEFSKPVFAAQASEAEGRAATQYVMVHVLNRVLKMLHPFCPFVTEELYQKLPLKNKSCSVDTYPSVENDKEFLSLGSAQSAFEVDLLKEVIAAVRNIRGENRISPSEKVALRLATDAATQKVLDRHRTTLMNLARAATVEIGDAWEAKKCALMPVTVKEATIQVIIPLEGLVDFNEEIKRIQKAIEKLNKDVNLLSAKLNNEKFIANADEDVVAADRELLMASKEKLIFLDDALARFKN